MSTVGWTLFDTALGTCAAAWSERGLTAVLLPEPAAALCSKLARRFPDAVEAEPPSWLRAVLVQVQALLAGEPADLAEAPLDIEPLPAFEARVYAAARTIPPGRAVTYAELAAMIGEPGAAQAVGRALGRNPVPIVVPCHRIVGAGGRMVGFSAPGGSATKRRLLAIEGARLGDEPDLFSPRRPIPSKD